MDGWPTVVIGAVSGLVGGFLSGGAYQHLRDHITRPVLTLDYLDEVGANKVETRVQDGAGGMSPVTYIRARLRNTGKRLAKNCKVYLTELSEVRGTEINPTDLRDDTPLSWPGWSFEPRDIGAGVEFYVDIVSIPFIRGQWNICAEKLRADRKKIANFIGTYRFQLTATADNADSAICVIDITYDQNYRALRGKQIT
jgi:hypothetical protein